MGGLILWLLLILLLPAYASAQTAVAQPECMWSGVSPDPTCFTTTDENRNGQDTSTPPTAAFATDGATGYVADLADATLVGPYSVVADASSPTGFAVEKATASSWFDGEIALRFSGISADDYYIALHLRNDGGPKMLWVKSDGSLGATFQNELGMIVTQTNPYAWYVVNANGTPKTFTLGTEGAIYIKSEDLFKIACIHIDTSLDVIQSMPTCPGQTGDLPNDYKIFEVGAETNPTAYNSAAFTHANVMQFTGTENPASPSICGGVLTVKALWDNSATDRMFWSVICNDTDDEIVQTTNDTSALLSTSQDRFNFRWRADLALTEATGLYGFVVNLHPAYSDWTHDAGGARDLATNLNMTIVKNVVSNTSWNMFIAHDLPGNSAGTVGICNAVLQDKDAGVATAQKFFHGNSITDLTQYGRCLWSADTVPASGGGGDSTAPVVTAFAVPSGQITGTSAQGTATTDEAGTCRFHAGTSTGVYSLTSPGSASSAGECQETITGLQPSTTYFAVMKVTDAAGNIGTSSEVSFATGADFNANFFMGGTATGDASCRSASNVCLPVNVWLASTGAWRNVTAGDRIQLMDGTCSSNNCRILPPANLNGTQTQPIQIRSQSDGGARIVVSTGRALLLNNNDWFVIQGMDLVSTSTTDGVVQIGSGADNNIVRRVCAWKPHTVAGDSDGAIWLITGNTGNLLEDVCGFGESRSIFGNQQNGNNSTIRRAFGQFSKSTQNNMGGKTVFTNAYNSTGGVYENVIANWNTTAIGDQPVGMLRFGPALTGTPACRQAKYLGSIAFVRSTDTVASWNGGQLTSGNDSDCLEARDVVLFIAPGTHTNLRTMSLLNSTQVGTGIDKFLTDITYIGGATNNIGSNWQQSGVVNYASQSAMTAAGASPWQTSASGDGARVCFRYVNGVLTSQALWPWPMNARIIAAMTAAGLTTVDVTATMESLLGTIPAGCRG